jgi:hypothetical protein
MVDGRVPGGESLGDPVGVFGGYFSITVVFVCGSCSGDGNSGSWRDLWELVDEFLIVES